MKVIKKVVAALMVLGALAALTVGVVLKPGRKGENMMLFGFAGIAAIVGLIFAAVVLVSVALQP